MNRDGDHCASDIQRGAERMQRARKRPRASPLRGLGVFGAVGWAVAVPTVAGALIGIWLNRVAPQTFSWPIALILGGVVIGGCIAWAWVGKESADPDASSWESHDDQGNDL